MTAPATNAERIASAFGGLTKQLASFCWNAPGQSPKGNSSSCYIGQPTASAIATALSKATWLATASPTGWPADRERRPRYIGEWLKTAGRYLGS
jgi:hypothetical protein